MKFSIVIPAYNASAGLPKTLDSILAQKCGNYEVIVVDGASTDNTLEVIKNYENKFGGRLRWISEKDKGVYDAMNKGIDMAEGKWIYFLGSGDALFSEDILEEISKKIGEYEPDVIYGNVEWGNTKKIYDGKFTPFKLMKKNICHQAIFFKKKLFDKLGKYNLKYKVLADHVFNMRWFNDESIRKKFINLTIARYDVSGQSSASSAPDKEFTKDRSRLIEEYFPQECILLKRQDKQNEKLLRAERELRLMKSSKFWKLRNFYMRLKSFLSSKNHS